MGIPVTVGLGVPVPLDDAPDDMLFDEALAVLAFYPAGVESVGDFESCSDEFETVNGTPVFEPDMGGCRQDDDTVSGVDMPTYPLHGLGIYEEWQFLPAVFLTQLFESILMEWGEECAEEPLLQPVVGVFANQE